MMIETGAPGCALDMAGRHRWQQFFASRLAESHDLVAPRPHVRRLSYLPLSCLVLLLPCGLAMSMLRRRPESSAVGPPSDSGGVGQWSRGGGGDEGCGLATGRRVG